MYGVIAVAQTCAEAFEVGVSLSSAWSCEPITRLSFVAELAAVTPGSAEPSRRSVTEY